MRAQLLAGPDWPILIAVYEWSGLTDQTLLVPWTTLTKDSDIDTVIARLKTRNRARAAPTTALGQAMRHGAALLRQAPPCRRLTLDISGDGKNNIGLRPQDVRGKGLLAGITVNALVIGADSPHGGDARQVEIGELSAYFRFNVIQGSGAFVEVALGFDDYARAMTEKLLRETQGPPIGWLQP